MAKEVVIFLTRLWKHSRVFNIYYFRSTGFSYHIQKILLVDDAFERAYCFITDEKVIDRNRQFNLASELKNFCCTCQGFFENLVWYCWKSIGRTKELMKKMINICNNLVWMAPSCWDPYILPAREKSLFHYCWPIRWTEGTKKCGKWRSPIWSICFVFLIQPKLGPYRTCRLDLCAWAPSGFEPATH